MSSERKKAHIGLALESQTEALSIDKRFNYEPLLSAHPEKVWKPFSFLGKTMRVPIWVSSMTGGTEAAMLINKNLATAAREYGMGMGLGSCRILLEDKIYPEHFMLREFIGDEVPFYANLGIAQIEKAVVNKQMTPILNMMDNLKVDGLIIHVNPLQEWLQPEGDRLKEKPIDMIKEFLHQVDFPVVVKEVGQGMGPASMQELMRLPLQAIDFAAYGGTNFAKLELLRNNPVSRHLMEPVSFVGNDAGDMIDTVNEVLENDQQTQVKEIIVSGGIKNFLDGYYYIQKSRLPAIYGQASMFLRYAREDYGVLQEFIAYQIKGLEVAYAYLTIKD